MKQENSALNIKIPVRVDNTFNITVNGVQISESEIGAEMQYHPAASKEQAFQLAARALVIRALLLQRAAELGLQGDANT